MSFERSKSPKISFFVITDETDRFFYWDHTVTGALTKPEGGTEDEIRVATSTHEIVVVGTKLYPLLILFSEKMLDEVRRDPANFVAGNGTFIRTVTMRAVK